MPTDILVRYYCSLASWNDVSHAQTSDADPMTAYHTPTTDLSPEQETPPHPHSSSRWRMQGQWLPKSASIAHRLTVEQTGSTFCRLSSMPVCSPRHGQPEIRIFTSPRDCSFHYQSIKAPRGYSNGHRRVVYHTTLYFFHHCRLS